MAKLKFAFQAEYYRTHRRQLRDYVFGYFHVAAGLAASVAPLTNALMGLSVVKNALAKVLGITAHRPFPKFSDRRSRLQRDGQGGKRVIFLSDAFARFIEPETEQAALDILSTCGFEVDLLPIVGAGASFLSKGFIDQARQHAQRVLDTLEQSDPLRETPIVGIEPPEIYTLKHDYHDLVPGRIEEIDQRSQNVWLLDEFLLRSPEFDVLRVAKMGSLFRGEQETIEDNMPVKRVFFHPHCHQRAEGPSSDGLPNGIHATVELLRSCGYEVDLLDTGCCGMAGTFGYEAEHYELSMKVGELKLFPAVRALELGDSSKENRQRKIASSGAACRMQIRQGTGLEAVHPILLAAEFISGNPNRE